MFHLIARWLLVAAVCCLLHSPVMAVAAAEAEEHPDVIQQEVAHELGVPMTWSRDLAFFSLVTFVIYIFALKSTAWGPLQEGLNERERGIKQNIADAESNRLKSESLLKEYDAKLAKVQDEVREILAEARRDAEHTKLEIVATAQKEADATKHRAIAEIERSRDQALTELFEFVSSNVMTATEHVIGRSLSGADQDRLVNDALSQMNVRRN